MKYMIIKWLETYVKNNKRKIFKGDEIALSKLRSFLEIERTWVIKSEM
jgi:hypothetical protein